MAKTPLVMLFLICSLCGFSQQEPSPPVNREEGRFAESEAARNEYLDSLYLAVTGMTHAYINGHEYYPYHYRSKYKPMLFHGKERTSSITVNDKQFDDLILQYDTYTDEVLFSEIENAHGKHLHQIAINREIIDQFTLFFRDDTLRFRYVGEQEAGSSLTPGFYEVAYEGPTVFLIRHRSVMHQRNGIDEYFWSPVRYIKTADGYQKISSNNKFIKLLGSGSAHMKRILSQRNVNLRKASKRQIIDVLKSYDSL